MDAIADLTLVERVMPGGKRESTIHVMQFTQNRTLCGRYVDFIDGWRSVKATSPITCERCEAAEKVRLRP